MCWEGRGESLEFPSADRQYTTVVLLVLIMGHPLGTTTLRGKGVGPEAVTVVREIA